MKNCNGLLLDPFFLDGFYFLDRKKSEFYSDFFRFGYSLLLEMNGFRAGILAFDYGGNLILNHSGDEFPMKRLFPRKSSPSNAPLTTAQNLL
jgi:hypothetical protein